MVLLGSLLCGLIFGAGLMISGMVHPTKVLAFLDIFGAWDPSLAVVMGAALVVTGAGYALARGRVTPLLAPESQWPAAAGIDLKLIAGAAIFGVGWGLSGLCPGPALENLVTLSPKLLVFVAAMIVGMIARDWQGRRATARPVVAAAADG
jgi:uncharacterized membrane protein YedE/YeeE